MLQGHSITPHFTTLVFYHTRSYTHAHTYNHTHTHTNTDTLCNHVTQIMSSSSDPVTCLECNKDASSLPALNLPAANPFYCYYLCCSFFFIHFGLEFISFHINSPCPCKHHQRMPKRLAVRVANFWFIFFNYSDFVFIWKWTWHAFSALLYCCLTLCCWFKQSPQWILYCHLKHLMWKWQWSFSHLKASRFEITITMMMIRIFTKPVGRFLSRHKGFGVIKCVCAQHVWTKAIKRKKTAFFFLKKGKGLWVKREQKCKWIIWENAGVIDPFDWQSVCCWISHQFRNHHWQASSLCTLHICAFVFLLLK